MNALGSETQTTDYAGNGGQGILFYPWGQVWQNPSGAYPNSFYQIFASLQLYDTSTDGYVPPFRYYIPEQGRWLTPDPAGKGAVHLDDPQTWNMYAYVRNNPTTRTDPSGLCGKPSGLSLDKSVFALPHSSKGAFSGASDAATDEDRRRREVHLASRRG